MEINRTPVHLVRETISWRKHLANATFSMTSADTAGTTKLKSAQERAAAKRTNETIRRAVPNHKVGLSTASDTKRSQRLLPISFIPVLRKTFPAAWAKIAGINTRMVFFREVPPAVESMDPHRPNLELSI
jgi:hypothetical protein